MKRLIAITIVYILANSVVFSAVKPVAGKRCKKFQDFNTILKKKPESVGDFVVIKPMTLATYPAGWLAHKMECK